MGRSKDQTTQETAVEDAVSILDMTLEPGLTSKRIWSPLKHSKIITPSEERWKDQETRQTPN